jgi:hypothetical protein
MDDPIILKKHEAEYHQARRKLLESDICSENKKYILEFDRLLRNTEISKRRRAKYIRTCRSLCEWLGKPLVKATYNDMERIMDTIDQ